MAGLVVRRWVRARRWVGLCRSGRGGVGPGSGGESVPPWPGRLPAPAPAVVLPGPLAATVHDAAGDTGAWSAPGWQVSAARPGWSSAPAAPAEIVGWAGPWPVDERWWAPAEARRRARFQVCLADGRALLLAVEAGQWPVEAIYD